MTTCSSDLCSWGAILLGQAQGSSYNFVSVGVLYSVPVNSLSFIERQWCSATSVLTSGDFSHLICFHDTFQFASLSRCFPLADITTIASSDDVYDDAALVHEYTYFVPPLVAVCKPSLSGVPSS